MNKKIPPYFFVIVILGFLSFFSFIHIKHLRTSFKKTPITKTLSIIPEHDRILLDQLFHHLIISERFAYTLFGEKPISISYCLKNKEPSPQLTTTPHPFTLKQWTTWGKYQHLFPSKNFILRKITDTKNDEAWIILINIKNFRKTVKKHRKLFCSILGPNTTPNELLTTFSTHPHPFKKALKSRVILKGILYGYGQKNASLFQRKLTIEKALLSDNTAYLKPTSPYKTLQEELQDLTHTLRLFSGKDHSLLRFPHFLVDHSTQETKDLKKKYNKQRTHFTPLLADKDFLERMLAHYSCQ